MLSNSSLALPAVVSPVNREPPLGHVALEAEARGRLGMSNLIPATLTTGGECNRQSASVFNVLSTHHEQVC